MRVRWALGGLLLALGGCGPTRLQGGGLCDPASSIICLDGFTCSNGVCWGQCQAHDDCVPAAECLAMPSADAGTPNYCLRRCSEGCGSARCGIPPGYCI